MKNSAYIVKAIITCMLLFVGIPQVVALGRMQDLTFESLPSSLKLPTEEVQHIYQDRDGFVWFATRNGLCCYDGYDLKVYKSNFYTPAILSSNDILTLGEDYDHNLWIGTGYGINMLDKKSGKIRKTFPLLENKRVQAILVTDDNKVFAGTSSGLYCYNREKEDFEVCQATGSETKVDFIDVKALIEDKRGDIWIGTWENGLYRYSIAIDAAVLYPRINPKNSAHCLFQDSNDDIWVGTWGYGLVRLINPYDLENIQYEVYLRDVKKNNTLLDNVVYAILEDPNTRKLWVGTRIGVSIFDGNQFVNYAPNIADKMLPHNDVNAIMRDNEGYMWLGLLGGGVCRVNTKKTLFELNRIDEVKKEFSTNTIRSIYAEGDSVWMGIGSQGFALLDRKTNTWTSSRNSNVFPGTLDISYFSINPSKDLSEIWLTSFGGGIYVYNKNNPEKTRVITSHNSDWLRNNSLYSHFEDKQGNLYIGSHEGLFIYTNKGVGLHYRNFTNKNARYAHIVYSMAQDAAGNIWLATDNSGIFKFNIDRLDSSDAFVEYSVQNGAINANEIQCVFVDSKGTIWVGTDGGGLNRYDEQDDKFIPVNEQYGLPGDMVCSILEDERYSLWMGSNIGLIRLSLDQNVTNNRYRLYTTSDGLQDNIFVRGAAYKTSDGEFFFAGHKGYNSFFPKNMVEVPNIAKVYITDIEILNRSLSSIDLEERLAITPKTAQFADTIVLKYTQNNFGFKFSVLNFSDPIKNDYAYRLVGFDKAWQHTTSGRNTASYNNLASGTYVFQIKGSSGNGAWSEECTEIIVIVKPPFWATWWAITIYIVLFFILALIVFRVTRNRIKLTNAIHIGEIERQKIEELNKAKLQFFTNVTHELLTPLTILSASLDELKLVATQYGAYYAVMYNNINRLKRLLQQILEFRKAETGNLKLRVSRGNLAKFVELNVDSFLPLIKKKQLQFTYTCESNDMFGYFDSDKVDKILYNLLSNAFKYNRAGEFVHIHLSYNQDRSGVMITIRDNGDGISSEKLKNIFTRFYEGDHRRYNTTGTGIGLSLTRDLVLLHGGTITVDSQPNSGSTFVVNLPFSRDQFSEEQIDDQDPYFEIVKESTNSTLIEEIPFDNKEERENKQALLLVEDNEDLLDAMANLLKRHYFVHVATNGREAIEVLKNEEIDMVVSDVMMPEVTGIELCSYMKNTVEVSHIPIILLTAMSNETDKIIGYEAGADGYITKPFSLTILLAKIRNLLKERARVARDFSKMVVFEMKGLNYNQMDEDFLQKAIDCVHANLDDPDFDQPQFSIAMGTSKSTLYKKLKSLTGLSTSAFITNIRLKSACKIMDENKTIRIAELAYSVGYNDPKYFSSCFKKEFGMLPSEYIVK